MIKCNHCGNITPVGAVCQSCGAPLASKGDDGFSPRMSAQEQPELPAWLESLRAGERSSAPTSSSSNFSTADFIEEGSLPNWMRAERNDTQENTSDHASVSGFSNPAFSDPNGGNKEFSREGINAQSLIDEKSLPSWMREGKQQSTPPAPGSLSASSLVQQDNVPEWMKSLQQPSGSVATPRSGGSSGKTTPPPMENPIVPQRSGSLPPAAGFSAHDLIDPQALPSWMQTASAQTKNTQNKNMPGGEEKSQSSFTPPPAPAAGQVGFSASSLLDVNALPQWLREGGRDARDVPPAPGSGQGNLYTGQSAQPQSSAFAAQPPPAGGSIPPREGLSASSFIDTNSLPSWLRSGSDQQAQPQAGMSSAAQSGPASISPRVNNMHVPSRPRGEVNPTESSELAANVFASMLGVASTTPNYSAPPQPTPANAANPYQNQKPSTPDANQYGQINQSGQQPNPYAQLSQSGQQPGPYAQMSQSGQQPNPYAQMSLSGQQPGPYAQMSQSGQQPGPYAQMSQSGQQPNPYGQLNQSGQQPNPYAQMSLSGQPGALGQNIAPQGSASQTNIPNPGAVPNTPSQMGGAYGQGYGSSSSNMGNSMSGVYGGNPVAVNPNQGNPSMSGMPPYAGNGSPMANSPAAQQIPDMGGDQRGNKKRGIFEAIRDWLSR